MLAATLKFAARDSNVLTFESNKMYLVYFIYFMEFILGITYKLFISFIRPSSASKSAILLNDCGGSVWDFTFHRMNLDFNKYVWVLFNKLLYCIFNFLLGVVIKGMKYIGVI